MRLDDRQGFPRAMTVLVRARFLLKPRVMPTATNAAADNAIGNRRAHRRAELRSSVAVCSELGPFSAVAFDVSPVGLGVELALALEPGAFVSVVFELPSGVVIDAQAQVARSAPPALGLKFHGLRQEERRELSTYCEAWRRELLERCSLRTGFDRTPVVTVPNSASGSPAAAGEPPQLPEADSAVRVQVSRIIDVTGD